MPRGMPVPGALVLTLAATLCTGCARTGHVTASSCGPAYTVEVGGRSVSDGCAGTIPAVPLRFIVADGSRFSVEIGHEATGALDFPIPKPANASVRRLSRHGARITYVADRIGHVTLIAHDSRYCPGSRPALRTCAAAVVSVTGG